MGWPKVLNSEVAASMFEASGSDGDGDLCLEEEAIGR